jgi:hypothetical protein
LSSRRPQAEPLTMKPQHRKTQRERSRRTDGKRFCERSQRGGRAYVAPPAGCSPCSSVGTDHV